VPKAADKHSVLQARFELNEVNAQLESVGGKARQISPALKLHFLAYRASFCIKERSLLRALP